MSDTTETLLVFCTCPDADTAGGLAGSLVEQGLAACVNQLPGVRSVFRWEGAVEQATEVLLLIKTSTGRFGDLEAAIRTEHPYELPEVIAVPITAGLPGYLDWIRAETG